MVKVIFLSNPFDTDNKTILEAPYIACKTVQGYVKSFVDYYPETEFHISINGHTLEDLESDILHPADGDNIVIIPVVGKGALNMIANIALMAFVNTITLGGSWFINALAKGAAMYVGGRIINAILPPPKLTGPESQNISPTYGWSGAKPIAATGTPIGRTFGTVKPAPVVLARHVTTDGDKQYINILYGGGEGPIDSVNDITIDGNPIANYKDVQVDIRLGTNDQEPITNFGDIFADQSLNYELTTDSTWATHQTEGNAGEGLEIVIEFPSGLYYSNDNGGLSDATVTVKSQYRIVGAIDWINWSDWTITAAKNTAVRKVFRLDKLPAGKYEVRCQCTSKSGTTTRYSTRVYWSQLSHIIYNDFARPGKVLVGIKALATDQLSGSDPDIGWTQTRNNANVWNPNTAKYEQKPLTNPYWACYDMIHNCKYLKNIDTSQYEYVVEGNPTSRIDYPTFAENAAYSSELDAAGDPRFELNLYLDTNISFWDALARLAVVGRGVIIPKGTKYSCICDKPAIPTQLFTMGNITEKSLKGKFQSTKDRSQSIEVEFFNKQKDYKQDLAIYYGDDWDTTTRVPNPTKVTRYGITKYKYAYREAVFLFKGNKYLKRTQNWEADIDAIACKPGDVVLLQHDVPKWGLAGGRIISATESTVTLDRDIIIDTGKTYAVEIRLLDDSRVKRLVQSVDGNILTLITPFIEIPQKYDLYAFGESNKVTKPFKIINIVKSKDLKCKLTGIEYIEEMYSDVVDIPIVNYSAFDNTPVEVEKSQAVEESFIASTGEIQTNINLSWSVPRSKKVDSFYIYVDGAYKAQTFDTEFKILDVIVGNTYQIKICTKRDFIISVGQEITIKILGNEFAVQNISNLALEEYFRDQGNGIVLADITVSWKQPDTIFYSHAEVYIKSNQPTAAEIDMPWDQMDNVTCSNIGDAVNKWTYINKAVDNIVLQNLIKDHECSIKVVAVNKGNFKADFDTAPVLKHLVKGKTYTPGTPSGLTVNITDKCEWHWNPLNSDCDFAELRTDKNIGQQIGLLTKTSSTKAIVMPPTRQGVVYLYAHNTAGYYSDPAILEYNKIAPVAPINITIVDIFQGVVISCSVLPAYCIGINVHINDGTGDKVYFSPNNSYSFKTTGGIFDISLAYVDIFGEGALSAVVEVVVKATIDPELLAAESLSLEKMDKVVKDAVAKAQVAIDTTTFNANVAALNKSITDNVGAINTSMVSLDNLKVSHTEFNNTANVLAQVDVDNKALIIQTAGSLTSTIAANKSATDNTISQISQTATQINATMVANKADIEGKLTAKAAEIKITTDAITSTVQSNKSATDNTISEISQTATQINATMVANKADADGKISKVASDLTQTAGSLTSTVSSNKVTQDVVNTSVNATISQIQQTASGITSTVQSNKTTQDGVNVSVGSQINQQAAQITSVVNGLAGANTAIAQTDYAVQLRATKADLISLINICPEAVTILSRLLHISGDTLIDGNVIANGMLKAGSVYGDRVAAKGISAEKIDVMSLSALCATIGTLRTATTGARTEIKDNLICVYDANNVLRVRMGVW